MTATKVSSRWSAVQLSLPIGATDRVLVTRRSEEVPRTADRECRGVRPQPGPARPLGGTRDLGAGPVYWS
ncbi:hypothetical protein J6590_082881 [Homalodisca vitripennis]|nr:hypothetical protein J6590_082881 [Homalodisca vitripennis]